MRCSLSAGGQRRRRHEAHVAGAVGLVLVLTELLRGHLEDGLEGEVVRLLDLDLRTDRADGQVSKEGWSDVAGEGARAELGAGARSGRTDPVGLLGHPLLKVPCCVVVDPHRDTPFSKRLFLDDAAGRAFGDFRFQTVSDALRRRGTDAPALRLHCTREKGRRLGLGTRISAAPAAVVPVRGQTELTIL